MSDLAQGALLGMVFGDKLNKLETGIAEIKTGIEQMVQLFHGILQNGQKPGPVIVNNGPEVALVETGEPIQGFHKDEETED